MRILGEILVAVVMMFVVQLLPALVAVGLGLPPFAVMLVAVPPLALLLVWAYRRFVVRRSWAGLGTGFTRWSIPQVLLGVLAGVVVLGAGSFAAVTLGAAEYVAAPQNLATPWAFLLGIPIYVLRAGYAEELLFRGHLWDMLSDRVRPATVLLLTSVSFGALHIISQSAADGLGERLLYVVNATALGFACGAARMRTGSVWPAAGLHTAVYLQWPVVEPIDFGVLLICQTVVLSLAAPAILAFPRRKAAVSRVPA
ncbi:type II CAAX endopeptidase family protein [Nonomuraea longicatena]|uniref:CAAX prenyl protease 2/Lysostaphin resistance protein A-like domain-containing protein n=1 Tax=Nonomuraea longicatena TaxID=83682 RepID=A0ABP3Z8P8_9ACTN